MAELANSAVLALASRAALFIVVGLIAWLGLRSLEKLDAVEKNVSSMAADVKVVTTKIDGLYHRVDLIEKHVFGK